MLKKISMTVNGEKKELEVNVGESLLDVLRNKLGLSGAKKGCGVGECGACTVLIDGVNIDTCIYLAVWADGKEIRTVEGLAQDGELTTVQKAFIEEGAVQCGFCTPGLVMSTTALAGRKEKQLIKEELKRRLSGHLCRCTGYQHILTAAEKVLED